MRGKKVRTFLFSSIALRRPLKASIVRRPQRRENVQLFGTPLCRKRTSSSSTKIKPLSFLLINFFTLYLCVFASQCEASSYTQAFCNVYATPQRPSAPSEMKRNGAYKFLSVFSCFIVCAFLFLFWYFLFYSMMHAP